LTHLNISVKDTALDPSLPPDTAKVYVRKKDGKNHYKVWIFLEGPDVPYVESVTYTLHSTFKNPVRRVPRSLSNPHCTLAIWTWGAFLVKATILDKQGRSYRVSCHLTFDKRLPTVKDQYVYENLEPDDSGARPRLVSSY
jgi:transcription initiation factor IIF auxiliary subunit